MFLSPTDKIKLADFPAFSPEDFAKFLESQSGQKMPGKGSETRMRARMLVSTGGSNSDLDSGSDEDLSSRQTSTKKGATRKLPSRKKDGDSSDEDSTKKAATRRRK